MEGPLPSAEPLQALRERASPSPFPSDLPLPLSLRAPVGPFRAPLGPYKGLYGALLGFGKGPIGLPIVSFFEFCFPFMERCGGDAKEDEEEPIDNEDPRQQTRAAIKET